MSELFVPTDYEELIRYKRPAVGLHSITCIHCSVLGITLGGTRILPLDPTGKKKPCYRNEEEAEVDSIRLAAGMTSKAAMLWPRFRLGGAKTVIIGDPRVVKTQALLRTYGEFLDLLGRFITGEDMNMSVADVEQINSRFVVGKSEAKGGSGNPAPMTALGCLWGQRAAMQLTFKSRKFDGRTLVFQGVGEVGFRLARLAKENGARIMACDVDQKKIERVVDEVGAEIVDPEKIFEVPGDIFVPCAGGGILNDETTPKLQCPIVAGPANNQLADPERHGKMLKERGITYAPDYVINAGGLINVACELEPGGYNETEARKEIQRIYDRVFAILEMAARIDMPPHVVAEEIVKKRVELVRKANKLAVDDLFRDPQSPIAIPADPSPR